MYRTNILEYLEDTVREISGRSALADGREDLSFFDLYTQSRSVGSCLCSSGIYREPVIILADKAPHTVALMLGVIYAGCFYVCLDTEMPQGRLLSVLEHLSPRLVIYDEAGEGALALLPEGIKRIDYRDAVAFAEDADALRRVRERHIDTDAAYIVFTSGSTGEPKGVVASHRSVIDYTEALCATLGFTRDTVFGNQAPLFYDAPLKEILPTLALGARTVFVPRRLFAYPVRLCELLEEQEVNTVCWVSSALCLVSSSGALDKHKPRHLKRICFGSEVMPPSQLKKWRAAYPEATFINLYGPTEATGMSCYWIADRELKDGEPIPIGRAFPNTEVILVRNGERVSEGEGEICIRGSCLALGYVGGNGDAFAPGPVNHLYAERVYRTGDIGRYNERGELVFICRADSQIKLMGHRIELGEIEAAAHAVSGVARACAILDSERREIWLCYTGDADEGEVSATLGERLPRYMLPHRIKRIEQMPLTESGKIDRRRVKSAVENISR